MAEQKNTVKVLAVTGSALLRRVKQFRDVFLAHARFRRRGGAARNGERRQANGGRRQTDDVARRTQTQAEAERAHRELQELIAELDSLRTDEQKRLAHELHDDFGQLLAALKMDVSTLREQLLQSDQSIVRHLESINELTDAMLASVRRIVADLPPKILEDLGLYSALRHMLADFERRHRISCFLQLSEAEPVLETRVAAAIYRVVQETLNNVAKHAGATCVRARVGFFGSHLKLSVQDNGRGMAPERMLKPGSFGLIGIRERIAVLGGEMTIDSRQGGGTLIAITIPVEPRVTS